MCAASKDNRYTSGTLDNKQLLFRIRSGRTGRKVYAKQLRFGRSCQAGVGVFEAAGRTTVASRLYETEFEDGCELPYIYLGDADDELHFW